jgi:hypothetical protein
MSSGLSLTEALEKMLQCNPSTCINPGFLAQLYFLSHCPGYLDSNEFKLLMLSYPHSITDGTSTASLLSKRKASTTESDDKVNKDDVSHAGDGVVCRQCKTALASAKNVLSATFDAAAFVKQHVDGFWRGYQPARSKAQGSLTRIPCKGQWAVLPAEWMLVQVAARGSPTPEDDAATSVAQVSKINTDVDIDRAYADEVKETALVCPGCRAEVGAWRRQQLDLIGIYTPCDLYALSESAVRIKRHRNVPA